MSQCILQPFLRFSYVTSSSLNSSGEPPMVLSSLFSLSKAFIFKLFYTIFHIAFEEIFISDTLFYGIWESFLSRSSYNIRSCTSRFPEVMIELYVLKAAPGISVHFLIKSEKLVSVVRLVKPCTSISLGLREWSQLNPEWRKKETGVRKWGIV